MDQSETGRPRLPAPVPLRPFPPSLPKALKSVFDREYDFLLSWQRTLFLEFTSELQAAVGQSLKNCLRAYIAVSSTDEDLGKQVYVEARDVVVTFREVCNRISSHKVWLESLNQARLDHLGLRYAQAPYRTLHEVLDYNNIIRRFVGELSLAMEKNNGVPWPLSRMEDCSDVTPAFLKDLIKSMEIF